MFNDLKSIRRKTMWASCFINTNVINNVNYFLLISGSNKETVFISVPAVSGKVLTCRINFGLKFTSNRGEIFIKRVCDLLGSVDISLSIIIEVGDIFCVDLILIIDFIPCKVLLHYLNVL